MRGAAAYGRTRSQQWFRIRESWPDLSAHRRRRRTGHRRTTVQWGNSAAAANQNCFTASRNVLRLKMMLINGVSECPALLPWPPSSWLLRPRSRSPVALLPSMLKPLLWLPQLRPARLVSAPRRSSAAFCCWHSLLVWATTTTRARPPRRPAPLTDISVEGARRPFPHKSKSAAGSTGGTFFVLRPWLATPGRPLCRFE